MWQKLVLTALTLSLLFPSFLRAASKCSDIHGPADRQEPDTHVMIKYREGYDQATKLLKIDRKLSTLEIEAMMDLLRGISIVATTSAGEQATLIADDNTVFELPRFLRQNEIVSYLPNDPWLKNITSILESACRATGRAGCDVYKDIEALKSQQRRPFTAREEKALRWATIYSLPTAYNTVMTAIAEASVERAVSMLQRFQLMGIAASMDILKSVFPESESTLLLHGFVFPFIEAGFEKAHNELGGKRPH